MAGKTLMSETTGYGAPAYRWSLVTAVQGSVTVPAVRSEPETLDASSGIVSSHNENPPPRQDGVRGVLSYINWARGPSFRPPKGCTTSHTRKGVLLNPMWNAIEGHREPVVSFNRASARPQAKIPANAGQ